MQRRLLIEQIHASPAKFALSLTGAGGMAIASLLAVPGCSRTLLHADVPYAFEASRELLCHSPQEAVSRVVARQLAQRAYRHGCSLIPSPSLSSTSTSTLSSPSPLFGVGMTAAITTDRTRRGKDMAFLCVWGRCDSSAAAASSSTAAISHSAATVDVYEYAIELEKGAVGREESEEIIANLVISAMANAAGVCSSSTSSSTMLSIADKEALFPTTTIHTWARQIAGGSSGSDDTRLLLADDPFQAVLRGKASYALWNERGDVRMMAAAGKSTINSATNGCDSAAAPSTADGDDLIIDDAEERNGNSAHGSNTTIYGGECHAVNTASTSSPATDSDSAPLPLLAPNDSNSGPILLLYPGSFRPLHWGHTELIKAAAKVLALARQQKGAAAAAAPNALLPATPPKVIATYEISTTVVDKGDLDEAELRNRIAQFTSTNRRVAITAGAKFFIDKARLFPNHGLVVGMDTVRRILKPQYYGDGSEAAMISALLEIKALGCYFVVGGRKDASLAADPSSSPSSAAADADSSWDELSRIAATIPSPIADMFIGIGAKDFRVDISSTELRALKGL